VHKRLEVKEYLVKAKRWHTLLYEFKQRVLLLVRLEQAGELRDGEHVHVGNHLWGGGGVRGRGLELQALEHRKRPVVPTPF